MKPMSPKSIVKFFSINSTFCGSVEASKLCIWNVKAQRTFIMLLKLWKNQIQSVIRFHRKSRKNKNYLVLNWHVFASVSHKIFGETRKGKNVLEIKRRVFLFSEWPKNVCMFEAFIFERKEVCARDLLIGFSDFLRIVSKMPVPFYFLLPYV